MKNGVAYQPPTPVGLFANVVIGVWYAGWSEAAYVEGLLPECSTKPAHFLSSATARSIMGGVYYVPGEEPACTVSIAQG